MRRELFFNRDAKENVNDDRENHHERDIFYDKENANERENAVDGHDANEREPMECF